MSEILNSRREQILARIVSDVRAANFLAAEEAANDARANAPEDTGDLKRSISAKDGIADRLTVSTEVRADAPYAAYVNYGGEGRAARPFMTDAKFRLRTSLTATIAGLIK